MNHPHHPHPPHHRLLRLTEQTIGTPEAGRPRLTSTMSCHIGPTSFPMPLRSCRSPAS